MEEWDILNRDREKTGRIAVRGQMLQPGDYHLVVLIFVVNANKEILITKRSKHKNGSGKWEVTGGAVIAGETSRQAAVRELHEEVGIEMESETDGAVIGQATFEDPHGWMADIWLFHYDCAISDLVLQEEEVAEAKWSTKEEIIEMIEQGRFFKGQVFVDEIFNKDVL